MEFIKADSYDQMSKKASMMIASQIIQNPHSVLGLATGSTPMGTYKKLVEYYDAGFIDFKDITTFNLDEYWKISKDNKGSYAYYMNENLFDHINIKEENKFIPDGNTDDPEKTCTEYDEKIKEKGNIDLQLLGIGNNAHIGFNEPCDSFPESTHLVQLTSETIDINSRFFTKEETPPSQALTLGLGGIMRAKKIILIANGKHKLDAIKSSIHGLVTPKVPASILQLHRDVTVIYTDEENY